jgi:hypothetical protein
VGRGLVLSPGAAGAPASARTLLALRRGTRAPSLGARAEQIYITLLVSAIALAVAWGATADAVRNVLHPASWTTWGAPLLAAGVVGALRLGVWQGPVAFSAPDIAHLLASPARRSGLVRPQLARACVLGALAAAVVAGAGLGGSVAVGEPVSPGWFAVAVAAAGALGTGATAGSWLVESSPAAARAVARAGAAAWLPVAALAAACGAGGTARTIALASGPWGWVVAVTAARPALAGAAAAATCAAALVAVGAAWRRAGAGTLEGFAQRAEARAGLIASAMAGDYRTAARVRRRSARAGHHERAGGFARAGRRERVGGVGAAQPGVREPAVSAGRWRGRLGRPPRPAFAIPWRAAVGLAREPSRLLTGPALGAVAVLAAVAHPDRGAWTAAAALAGFAAAVVLLEPARVEADIPDRTRALLGRRPEEVVAGHCAVPLGVLLGATLPALLAAALTGVASPGAATVALLVAVPGWALLVLCGAGSARRGGRLPLEMVALAATDATGGLSILAWLFAWPLGAAVAVSAALVPAARHGSPVTAVVTLAVLAALVYGFVRRPTRP